MSETRIFTVDVKVRVRSRGRGGGPAGAVQRSPRNDEARELTPGSRATLKRRILPATRAPLPAGRVADRRGALVPAVPDRAETVLALANGYVDARGTLEESHPALAPGTFVNGFHETWPIASAGEAY